MRRPGLALYTRILIGFAAGILIGLVGNQLGWAPFMAAYFKPFGTAFIRLISMVVVPLVFASLVIGTGTLSDVRRLGRMGLRTFAYYLLTTAVAVTIGLLLANLIHPGQGLSPETKEQLLSSYRGDASQRIEQALQKPGVVDVLLDIIPTNPVRALAEAEMLQVIFFALALGVVLTMLPRPQAEPVLAFFNGLNEAMLKLVLLIMELAPYGVFALIGSMIAEFGLGILGTLARYSVVVIAGLILHAGLIYPALLKLFTRLSVGRFFRGIRPAQLIAFSSSSSSATLPVTMECVENNLGVSKSVSGFVLPLGATINMDGTALYQGVAAVFIAEVFGLGLTLGQQGLIVLTATLASIGAAGVPGVGMITLALVLKTIGVPLEGIALILGVDRLLDMCRTVVNVTGDASCAAVIASLEGEALA